ncbi:hypothetical protein O181_034216 [Austropuccinia psidii MF-1]|uniref:Uncharacterized protein n=1 Tax=Austropuccinia psidii MF-1 TaxID=1389203 RepID=A0A9Q3H7T6_9BASI|nr:hypothetical protein [Austropuccinia psidii MF-1]
MSHTYIPAHAHAHATVSTHTHTTEQAPTHARATAQAPEAAYAQTNSGSTCVTLKWLMPLDIRPSQALPLCACGTLMHPHPNPLHCAEGSNHVSH